MSLQTLLEKQREEFKRTTFAKGGGSCFECCDYEGMYTDLLSFLTTIQNQIVNAVREKCEDVRHNQSCNGPINGECTCGAYYKPLSDWLTEGMDKK